MRKHDQAVLRSGPRDGAMMRMDCVNPWSWYPVAASTDLAPGKLLPVSLGGEELVAWRSGDGVPAVWSNRCPHRGMRLMFGAVAGNALTCAYHGWVFENSGACSHIPAHPRLEPSAAARVRIYPVREMYGYVWACLGEPATAEPSSPTPGTTTSPVRSLHVTIAPEAAIGLAVARPLAWWTPADPLPAGWQQSAALAMTGDAVTLETAAGASTFKAVVALPGTIDCEATEGAQRSRYTIRMQPTGAGAAALHLAIDGEDALLPERRLAINRAFVQMRRDAAALAAAGMLEKMQALVAETRAADAIVSLGEVG